MDQAVGLSAPMSVVRRYWLPLCVLGAIALGVWLRWGALRIGFHGDDHVQIGMLRGEFPAPRSRLDLFRFADTERDGQAVIEFGYDPWWTHPKLKIAMFRPLASGLIALDHALFGANSFAHHIHSFVWWVLLIAASAALFRVILPARVAAIAVVLYAIEEAHTVPVAWLANRSTLVSTAFGLFGVFLHLRYRDRGRITHRLGEALAFALALAGGEYGFAVLAYVVAYELLGAQDAVRARLRALIPAGAAAIACLTASALLGYGVRGSGAYISPTGEPAEFVRAAVERVPVLVGDLIWGIRATYWVDGVPWAPNFLVGRSWQSFLGAAAIVALVLVARYIERSDERYRCVRWLSAGALLSVVPGAGALPEDRTLVAAAVGASAVMAILLVRGYDAALGVFRRKPLVPATVPLALAIFVAYVHGAKAWERSREQVKGLALTVLGQRQWALNAAIPDAGLGERHVILLTGADFTTIANLPWVRRVAGHPLPRSYWRLSGALHVHDVFRIAPNVIDVAVLSNELDDTVVGSLYRSKKAGFRAGDIVTLPGVRVEVIATDGPNPWRTRFTFERSLDDASYLFVHSTPNGIRPFSLPAVGEKTRLSAPSRPRL